MASASRKHGVGRGPPVLIGTGEVGNLRLLFPRGWEASGCVRFRPPSFCLSQALRSDTLFPRWVLCERHPGSRSATLQPERGAAVLGSGRRGADPAASSRHRGAAGPAEFPRVVGGGAIGTVWVPGWRRRSGKPVPALALLGVGESSGAGIRREPILKLSLEPRVPFVFLGSGRDALVAILSFWPR